MIVVGIDVGISGGLASLTGDSHSPTATVIPMPIIEGTPAKGSKAGSKSMIDILGVKKWIEGLSDGSGVSTGPIVALEIQHPMSKQGVTSMFNLGRSYESLRTLALVMGWRLILVQPQRWKNEILNGTTKDKSAAIQWSMARYPQVDLNVGVRKVIYHDGMADALCIAQYGLQEINKSQPS